MAKRDKTAGEASASGGSLARRITTIVMLSVLAVGLGGGFGFLMMKDLEAAAIARYKAEKEERKPPESRYSGDVDLKKVPAIVTNLANSATDWVRLEASIIFKKGTLKNPEIMVAETRQDLMIYLRTVSLAQIQGPSGLMHLREDLTERAQVRSNGEIQELILETLVVQ